MKKHITMLAVLLLIVPAVSSAPINNEVNRKTEFDQKEDQSVVITEDLIKGIGKIKFIHYKNNTKKAMTASSNCYKLMGVKWSQLPVKYVINPNNPQGLLENFVNPIIGTSAETWDAATSKELFDNNYLIDYNVAYSENSMDSKNSISFGDYPNNGVIAVTNVWYNIYTRRISEFDLLFNTRYTWGNADENDTVMDFQNIATHELGHSVGMNDVYTSSCGYVTMYGYSNYGDTQKRDLASPDKTGLRRMYGI